MILRIFTISALALCAGSFVESARSAEFFVCGNGKTIQIETANLEEAKRTNACVARHFGLSIEPKVQLSSNDTLRASTSARLPGSVVEIDLPVRKPRRTSFRKTVSSHRKSAHRTSPNLMAKIAPADFRKVRIINAAPGAAKWFNHRR